MPRSTIDWPHALTLFNQGLKIPQIAKVLGCKYDTVKTRSKRDNWVQRRDMAIQAVSEVVQNMVKDHPKTVQQRAEKWVEREVSRVEKLTDVLDLTPIVPTIAGLREHIEVAAMNGKYGRSTFGLDSHATNVQVNVGMFGLSDVQPAQIQDQTIDIDPTPTQPEST